MHKFKHCITISHCMIHISKDLQERSGECWERLIISHCMIPIEIDIHTFIYIYIYA